MSREFLPSAALWDLCASVVDSTPVLSVYASCEWEELNDDGRTWICAIVQEALKRQGVALVPVLPVKLVDVSRRSEDPRLAMANDNGGAL